MSAEYRIETDSLGEVEVPNERLWGAQTQRALGHFHQGGEQVPEELLRSIAWIKIAAARSNCSLGILPKRVAYLIEHAALAIVRGELNAEFPLSIWQSGSGTQTNMNVNEVVANYAARLDGEKIGRKAPVHPNDHVNLSQSTNDVFPTAMHMAVLAGLERQLLPALEGAADALREKAKAFSDIIKVGRTHLQDAVPLTLGQEFSGYVAQVESSIRRLHRHMEALLRLPLGGTAVGTGLNAPDGFAQQAVQELRELAGFPFVLAPNRFALMAAHDDIVAVSGAIRTAAMAVYKIANDVRWLGSGPRCGLGELALPDNEPGSSIMPGKVNPSQCEALAMACTQVVGFDTAVAMAGSQGNFELNVHKPLIIYNVMASIRILSESLSSFTTHCATGLLAREDNIDAFVHRSLMLVTVLNPHIGYDQAARAARYAHENDVSLKEACQRLDILSGESFDKLVVPESMVDSSG